MHTNDTNIGEKILYKDLSYKITGLCFKVHNELGRFCREKQYSEYLEKYLQNSKISFKKEVEINSIEADSPLGNKADFIVENKIILELKAKKFITKEDYYQIQRYLLGANLKLGILVNFRNTFLKPKRIINSRYNKR